MTKTNASNVFETLNDRGISLSTPDLLRNLILRRAPNDAQRDEIIEAWRTIIEIEEDVNIDDFLRHYWISRNGDIKSRKLYHEMKGVIEAKDIGSLDLSLHLQRTSLIYRQIISSKDADPEVQDYLVAIKMLGAKALLPAVLSAYLVDKPAERKVFLGLLVSLYVRYAAVSNLELSRLEDVVYDVAKNLSDSGDFAAAAAAVDEIRPTNEAFQKRFGTFQVTRRETQRYLLQKIENHLRRQAAKTGELQVSGPDRVHVEHIYPQRPEVRLPDHQDLVNRFGNLTLLDSKLNQSIQNGPFEAKKPSYAQSDLLLTQGLLQYGGWNRDTIDDRQQRLAESATIIWN